MATSGDKVKLHAQERFDLPDANALQSLLYSYMESALGALLGYGNGCLSRPTLTFTQVGAVFNVTFGAFQLYYSQRETLDPDGVTYKTWRGRVLSHVPGGSQVSVLDYTAARAAAVAANVVPGGIPAGTAGAFPFLWARPLDLDTDTANRRQWSIPGGTEQLVALLTRTRAVVEFKLGDKQPPTNDGKGEWCVFGKITAWNGAGTPVIGTPTITLLPVWDGGGVNAANDAVSDAWLWVDSNNDLGSWWTPGGNNSQTLDIIANPNGLPGVGSGAVSDNWSLGLVHLLSVVRSRFKELLANDGTAAWYDLPAATLKALAGQEYVYASAIVDNTGAGTWELKIADATYAGPKNITGFGVGAQGVGAFGLTWNNVLPAGHKRVGIFVTASGTAAARIAMAKFEDVVATRLDVTVYDAAGLPADVARVYVQVLAVKV